MKACISSITAGNRKYPENYIFWTGQVGREKKSLPANAPFENFVQFLAILFDFFPHWWLMSDRLHQVAPYSESFGDIHVLLIAQKKKEHSSNVSSLPVLCSCLMRKGIVGYFGQQIWAFGIIL